MTARKQDMLAGKLQRADDPELQADLAATTVRLSRNDG